MTLLVMLSMNCGGMSVVMERRRRSGEPASAAARLEWDW